MIDDLDTTTALTTDDLRAALENIDDAATVIAHGDTGDWGLDFHLFAIGVAHAGYLALTAAPVAFEEMPVEDGEDEETEEQPITPKWWHPRPALTVADVRGALDHADKLRAEHGLGAPGPVVVFADLDGEAFSAPVIKINASGGTVSLDLEPAF